MGEPAARDRAIEAVRDGCREFGVTVPFAGAVVDALLSNPGVLRALAASLPARQLTDGDNGGPTVAGHILAQIGAILTGSSVAPADATHAHQTTKGNRS